MNKLKKILSSVLEIDTGSITLDTSPENVDSWDSFNGLMLVSELEESYDLKFSTDEVVEVKNVGDIVKALKRHGVSMNE